MNNTVLCFDLPNDDARSKVLQLLTVLCAFVSIECFMSLQLKRLRGAG